MYQVMMVSALRFLSRSFRIEENVTFHNNLDMFKLNFQGRNKILKKKKNPVFIFLFLDPELTASVETEAILLGIF